MQSARGGVAECTCGIQMTLNLCGDRESQNQRIKVLEAEHEDLLAKKAVLEVW